MRKSPDLEHQKFGRLEVIRRSRRPRTSHGLLWVCKCECSNKLRVITARLLNGNVKSCGCLRRDIGYVKNWKHGLSKTREFRVWFGAKRRCRDRHRKEYKNYGGRGIKMCHRWRHSFQKFYDDMEQCPKGSTLERVDNDGNYEPGNCIWADRYVQNNNRRSWHRRAA